MCRSMLIVSVIAVLFCCQIAATQATVIGLWDFSEKAPGETAPGGTTILDSSGNGRNGTVVGAGNSYIAGDPARSDPTAMCFAGGYIDMGADAGYLFSAGGAFTLEADIRFGYYVAGYAPPIMSCKNVADPKAEWWLRVSSVSAHQKKLETLVYDGGAYAGNFYSTSTPGDGAWHHVAMVYDGAASGGTLSLYVDYVLDSQQTGIGLTGSIGSSTDKTLIGKTIDRTYLLYGDISFIRLSSGALGPSEFIHEIPEPTTLALLVTGLIGLLCYAWRKRK